MNKYSLPIDHNCINSLEENISVDMSKLNFDVPIEDQKKASFVFLRNSNIKANLDFSSCNYNDKAEYLLLYLCSDIEVNAEILSTTWIEILSTNKDGGEVYLPSILSLEEIKIFVRDNKTLIDEIYQLINSLPIYAMYCSNQYNNICNMDEFTKTNWHKVKIDNFWKLAKYDHFIFLVDGSTESLFYDKLFIRGEYHISKMMDYLPFLNLLTAMLSCTEIQNEVIDNINNVLTPPATE